MLETSFVEIAIRQMNLPRLQAGSTRYGAKFIQATFRFQADFNQRSVNCSIDNPILYR